MAISSRQVQNKRDGNGVLTGRPGTVYDVNIKYKAPDGTKKSYAKKGFSTKKEAAQQLLVDFKAFQPENANRFDGMLCTLPEPEDEDGEGAY